MRKLYYTPYPEDVEDFLFQHISSKLSDNPDYKVLYLTPTMFLYRRRISRLQFMFRKEFLKSGISYQSEQVEQWIHVREFDQWARELVYELKKANPLSRTESLILIKRAIENVLPGRRDWQASSMELMELMQEFDTTTLSVDDMRRISRFGDWTSIISIYENYLELIKQSIQQSYGQCLKNLITHDEVMNQYDELIFDGPFLFFKPIHEALMQRFDQDRKSVTYIIPYQRVAGQTNPAFDILKKTYTAYVPYEQWKSIGKQFVADSTDLEQLRTTLFTEQSIENRGSLSIHSHSTVEQEIRHVILKSKALLETGEGNYKSIIIVTPDAMALRPLIREIAEQEQLPVEVPERSLLGLTAGEFIQLIYQIRWDDRRFNELSYIDASMFKRVIDSGWFPQAKKTIRDFQIVEEIFFRNISTLPDWNNQFSSLQSIKGTLTGYDLDYHPLHAVKDESFTIWQSVITELQRLQASLCMNTTENIHTQVNQLISELDQLALRYGFGENESTEGILNRIRKFGESTKSHNRIPISTEEFGMTIHQFFIEDPVFDEEDGTKGSQQREILVTGPENIAFLDYKFVFMIQFTQDRFPSIPHSRWPLHHDIEWRYMSTTTSLRLNSINEWEQLISEREKYYFYLAFYVPKVEMQISFARTESGERVYPSHYLNDLGRSYRLNEQTAGGNTEQLMEQLEDHGIAFIHRYENETSEEFMIKGVQKKGLFTKHATLTIEDVAIYRLCPTRFYYSKLLPESNVYSNRFQLGRYIAVVLAQKVLKSLFLELSGELFTENLETMSKRNQILFQNVPKLLEKEETELSTLFPIEQELWENGLYYADIIIKNIIKQVFNERYAKATVNKGVAHLKASFEVVPKVEMLQVNTSQNSYLITGVRDLHAKFGNSSRMYSLTHYPHLLGISSYESEDLGEEDFPKWFYHFRGEFFNNPTSKAVQDELQSIIRMMEEGHYPKREGTHCSYCPFQMSCQKSNHVTDGLSLQEDAEPDVDE